MFFWTFWPQDLFYLTAILILSALSLFLFTAIAGRLWCGFRLPQTVVWTEVFLWIEAPDRWRPPEADEALDQALEPREDLEGHRKILPPGSCFPRLDRLHLRWLLTPIRELDGLGLVGFGARAVGDVLDTVLRLRHLRQRRLVARAGLHLVMCPYARFQGAMFDLRYAHHLLTIGTRRTARHV